MASFASATEGDIGTFKKNECVSLLQNCANCTYVNFTSVRYPNSTIAATNLSSTQTGSVYNYSFCSTQALGQYIVNGVGDIDGKPTVFAYTFDVTPTGNKETSNPISLAITIFFLLFNIGLFALYFIKKYYTTNYYSNLIIRRSIIVIAIFFTMWNISLLGSLVAASSYDIMPHIWQLMNIIGWSGYISIIILVIGTIFSLVSTRKKERYNQRFGGLE